ncbi:hypothetical protein AOLI_G00305450, partial [Acnodon oligacanthus]
MTPETRANDRRAAAEGRETNAVSLNRAAEVRVLRSASAVAEENGLLALAVRLCFVFELKAFLRVRHGSVIFRS